MAVGRTGGVAYPFWLALERCRAEKGLSQKDLVARSGIPASTINNLKTSTRAPQPRIVLALANAVGMDPDEALRLAGVVPTPPAGDPGDVRAAIEASPAYTDEQKHMLLQVVDLLDRANGTPPPRPTVRDDPSNRDYPIEQKRSDLR